MRAIPPPPNATNRALQIIAEAGGIVRTKDALNLGIHPRDLYRLRDTGAVEQLSRGVFGIPARTANSNSDFLIIKTRYPHAVVCLVSALAIHELTTQIPHTIELALARGTERPRLQYPPTTIYRFSPACYRAGIELHDMGGVAIQVYSAEKTLADCFKFRGRLGMEIVLEALRYYRERMPFNGEALLRYARLCRVERVMRPYLEAIL